MVTGTREPPGDRRGEQAARLVELFVLAGLAIAQPLLEVTGKAPDFFVAHRADQLDLLALVTVVTVAPPTGLWTVGWLTGLVRQRMGRLAHHGTIVVLGALLAVQVAKHTLPLRGTPLVGLAILAGLGLGWLYRRQGWLRLWLRYLAPAPLVFALLFATTSPSGTLLLSNDPKPHDAGPVAGAAPRPPVVLVFFDEFPLQSLLDSHGRIDRRVYPNFAAFADQATWYRNATGVSGSTQWAVPAMLTGRYPAKAKAPTAREYPNNLFSLLGHSYHLEVSETVTKLCPTRQCGAHGTASRAGAAAIIGDTARLFGQLVSPFDRDTTQAGPAGRQPTGSAPAGMPGPAQLARWGQFVASIQRTDPQPTLYFEHVLLPHGPWQYLPDGISYPADSYGMQLKEAQYGHGVWEVNHERHLLQLAMVDTLVGQLIARLKQQGLWDRALVVLTADHGNGFSVGETARTLGSDNAASLLWVPMLLKAPRQTTGRVDDRNWEQVDLLPTLADLVHVPVPWPVDGVSQTGPPRRHTTQKSWYDTPGRLRVRDNPDDLPRVLGGVTDTLVHGEDGQRGLYRYGPAGDWVARAPQAVAQLAHPTQPARRATLVTWNARTSVDPATGHVPALLVGQLSPNPPAGAMLAVVINGRIGAMVEPFPGRPGAKPTRFAAILPDFLFHPGPALPQLDLYLVEYLVEQPASPPVMDPIAVER